MRQSRHWQHSAPGLEVEAERQAGGWAVHCRMTGSKALKARNWRQREVVMAAIPRPAFVVQEVSDLLLGKFLRRLGAVAECTRWREPGKVVRVWRLPDD